MIRLYRFEYLCIAHLLYSSLLLNLLSLSRNYAAISIAFLLCSVWQYLVCLLSIMCPCISHLQASSLLLGCQNSFAWTQLLALPAHIVL